MRSIRIPYRVAREIRAWVAGTVVVNEAVRYRLLNELEAAMAVKKSVKASRVRRTEKKKSRKSEMADLRAKVFARAGHVCESACDAPATELDHHFGRVRVKQSPVNCRALCSRHHRMKTDNIPSAAYWQQDFINHCNRLATSDSEHMSMADWDALGDARKLAEARLDSLTIAGRTGGETL